MTGREWLGLAVGLVVVVGVGYSLVAWWRDKDPE
jgi:hypothetical protein